MFIFRNVGAQARRLAPVAYFLQQPPKRLSFPYAFGLVSIPVKPYSAIEDHDIRSHLLHKKCGSRGRNQLFCPACKIVIERDETVRGYEVT